MNAIVDIDQREADVNAVVGGYLRDLAFAQPTRHQMFGYKRAAAAVFGLDVPLSELAASGGPLPRIHGIGPASWRVIREGSTPAHHQPSSAPSTSAVGDPTS